MVMTNLSINPGGSSKDLSIGWVIMSASTVAMQQSVGKCPLTSFGIDAVSSSAGWAERVHGSPLRKSDDHKAGCWRTDSCSGWQRAVRATEWEETVDLWCGNLWHSYVNVLKGHPCHRLDRWVPLHADWQPPTILFWKSMGQENKPASRSPI